MGYVILPEKGEGEILLPQNKNTLFLSFFFFPSFFFFSFFCCVLFEKYLFLSLICNDSFSYFIPLDSLRLMNSKFISIIEPHYCHLYVKKMLKSLIKMNKIK